MWINSSESYLDFLGNMVKWLWYQRHNSSRRVDDLSVCDNLINNDFHGFIYLNARLLVGGTVWKALGGITLLDRVSLMVDFEVSNTCDFYT